jgi:hypothetical protein
MIVRPFVLAMGLLTLASTSQAQQKEPIGPFVVDLRAVSSGLPAEPGWTPLLPAATVVPSRGLGFEVGAHVNLLRRRSIALGVGATWLKARGSTSPPGVSESATSSTAQTNPDVTTRVTAFAPQVSLNFGHSLGWSYLSVGLGRSRTESEASLAGGTTTFRPSDSGWVKTLNYGGGARWFLTDRLGVGFDLRWHKVGLVPASAAHPGAGRASLFVAGVGIVIK